MHAGLQPGDEHRSSHATPQLWALLDRLGRALWPRLLRGDAGFGSQNVMREAESRGINYLFKLRLTKNVKSPINRTFSQRGWQDAGQGWQGQTSDFRLVGWSRARLELKFKRIVVQPPIGKQKRYPPLRLSVLHATERHPPKGRKPIEWKLITTLPVRSRVEAIEKLDWYAMRWKIEVFHKILKSGYKAEESKLRTADRLANLIALFCILSWRVFWLTMLNRTMPDVEPQTALTETEIRVLDRLVPDPAGARRRRRTLSHYLTKLARLGGYLARASDPLPGNIVMWRGLSRLTDIQIGVEIGAGDMGN